MVVVFEIDVIVHLVLLVRTVRQQCPAKTGARTTAIAKMVFAFAMPVGKEKIVPKSFHVNRQIAVGGVCVY